MVGSAVSLGDRVLNFPGASFPDQAVVAEAQALSADMAMALCTVIDCAQLSFFAYHRASMFNRVYLTAHAVIA
jgi:hypothetical protein